jgi:GNAT superfamily N-acetyltransferase
MESLTHFRKFMSAARAVSRVKPIIALKAGRTRAGALAAASHTAGALAGEDAVYDAAFQRAGILRVKTFEELFDCAELLAKQPKPKGPGLAIITNAGGPGVMAADALSDYGYEPVSLSRETLDKLNEILPPFWSKRNPIDMLGDASPELFGKVVKICLAAKEVDGLLIMSAPQALADASQTDEKMLGVARIILGRDLRQAEFSVVIGDPWQGKGIGATLLQRCLGIARERGIREVTGTVLAENTQMLALGRKLGFKMKKEPSVPEYELSIDLGQN